MAGITEPNRRLTRIAYQREVCLLASMQQCTSVMYCSRNRDAWTVIDPDGDLIVLASEIAAMRIQALVWCGVSIPTLAELDDARQEQQLRLRPPK